MAMPLVFRNFSRSGPLLKKIQNYFSQKFKMYACPYGTPGIIIMNYDVIKCIFLQICIRWRFWFVRKPHQIDRSSDVYGNEPEMRVQVSEVALFHILRDLI